MNAHWERGQIYTSPVLPYWVEDMLTTCRTPTADGTLCVGQSSVGRSAK
jgi:hypothetical protein